MSPLTIADLVSIYSLPFSELLERAHCAHLERHPANHLHLCAALSIKTGRCPEDCAYCPQSAHYATFVKGESLLPLERVLAAATKALSLGASHLCLGAAWGLVPTGQPFEAVLEMVSAVAALGLQVCCSLGSITEAQAEQLLAAGCSIYNYNLDASPEFYPTIITTRSFDFRYQTLLRIRASGLQVSCGGILGMGETVEDRLKLLHILSHLHPQPEMVVLNQLVAISGTPLAEQPPLDPLEYVRIVALARLLMPKASIALAAGRQQLSQEAQALAFYGGGNAVYIGERILVTPTPDFQSDLLMFQKLGLNTAKLF